MGYQTTFTHDVWHREAATLTIRNGIRTRRWGMRVTVFDDPVAANNGDWVLSYSLANTNRQSNLNWLKVADIGVTWGGGVPTVTGAGNGLHMNGTDVYLGGTLLEDTTIDGDGQTFGFYMENLTEFSVNFSNGNYQFMTDSIVEFFNTQANFNIANGFGVQADVVSINASTEINLTTAAANIILNSADAVNVDAVFNINLFTNGSATMVGNTSAQVVSNTGFINFEATEYRLAGNAPVSPTTQFFRGDGTWAVPAGGGIVTADNGLTVTGTNVQLGGALIANTTIDYGSNSLQISGGGSTSSLNVNPTTVVINSPNSFTATADDGANGGSVNITPGNMTLDHTQDINISTGGTVDIGNLTNAIVNLNASGGTGLVNINTPRIQLQGLFPSSPSTEFFRGDGTWAVPAAGGVPGGPALSIQFNNSGAFGGEGDFSYDNGSNIMSIRNGVNQMQYSALGIIRYISGVPQMLLDNDELSTPAASGLLFRLHPSGPLHLVPDNGTVLIGSLGVTAPVLQATSTNANTNFTIRAGGAGNIIMDTLPTSSAGLPTGAIWNNSGVLNIV